MASSIGRKRRNTASPSIKELIQGSPSSLIDALAVLAIGLSVGLLLAFSEAARGWTIGALGYGWVPVGLFVAVIISTLRYNRHILFAHWRRWIVAATLVAMSIGVLSTIFPSDGALKDVSLGGRWGSVLGGAPAILAALKIAGMALVLPLVIAPKKTGGMYLRFARKGLSGFQLALICLYIAGHQSARFLDRRYRILRYGMHRQSSGGNLLKMLVLGPSKVPTRTRANQVNHESSLGLGFDPEPEDSLNPVAQPVLVWNTSIPVIANGARTCRMTLPMRSTGRSIMALPTKIASASMVLVTVATQPWLA